MFTGLPSTYLALSIHIASLTLMYILPAFSFTSTLNWHSCFNPARIASKSPVSKQLNSLVGGKSIELTLPLK